MSDNNLYSIFNSFSYFEPVKRTQDRSDMTESIYVHATFARTVVRDQSNSRGKCLISR